MNPWASSQFGVWIVGGSVKDRAPQRKGKESDWNDPILGSLLLYAPALPGSLQYRVTAVVAPYLDRPRS